MATIVTRDTGATAKGGPLTNTEMDNNLINLNDDKMEKANNLNDVSNTATARTNLGVYSTSETDAQAEALAVPMAIALG